jgi:hypothetical protein
MAVGINANTVFQQVPILADLKSGIDEDEILVDSQLLLHLLLFSLQNDQTIVWATPGSLWHLGIAWSLVK